MSYTARESRGIRISTPANAGYLVLSNNYERQGEGGKKIKGGRGGKEVGGGGKEGGNGVKVEGEGEGGGRRKGEGGKLS